MCCFWRHIIFHSFCCCSQLQLWIILSPHSFLFINPQFSTLYSMERHLRMFEKNILCPIFMHTNRQLLLKPREPELQTQQNWRKRKNVVRVNPKRSIYFYWTFSKLVTYLIAFSNVFLALFKYGDFKVPSSKHIFWQQKCFAAFGQFWVKFAWRHL